MVICLERGADLHMAQQIPLSLASVKSRLVLPFWYRLTRVVPDKGLLNGCVCTCYSDSDTNATGALYVVNRLSPLARNRNLYS